MAENNDRYTRLSICHLFMHTPVQMVCAVGTFSMILGGITPEPEMASKPGIQDRMYFPTDWSNELPLIFNI